MKQNILERAITKETLSRDFYARVAKGIKNRQGIQRMQNLSREEESHRKILAMRYSILFEKEFIADSPPPDDPKYRIAEAALFDHPLALEILSLAIGLEQESISDYRKQLATVDDPNDRNILDNLVRFEESHKKRLEEEYERVQKEFYWMT